MTTMTGKRTLSQMYPNGIPSKDAKRVVVEVFCGTKSVAKVAKPYANASMTVYTVDLDPKCIPRTARAMKNHYHANVLGGNANDLPHGVTPDMLGGINIRALCKKLDQHLKAGHVIMMHGSPPCDQVSVMNTTGFKNRNFPAKLGRSLRAFHAFAKLAKRYAVAWTLENPATGRLWKPTWLREHLTAEDQWLADVPDIWNYATVDYCQYGWCMKKETGIAFSSRAMLDIFRPYAKRCPGCATCEMCIPTGRGNRRSHAVKLTNLKGDYDCSTKHARYPIPPALVKHMIDAMRTEADRVLGLAADADMRAYTAPAAAPAAFTHDVDMSDASDASDASDEDMADMADMADIGGIGDIAWTSPRVYTGPTIGRVLEPFTDPLY
jgi:hypothetical protein